MIEQVKIILYVRLRLKFITCVLFNLSNYTYADLCTQDIPPESASVWNSWPNKTIKQHTIDWFPKNSMVFKSLHTFKIFINPHWINQREACSHHRMINTSVQYMYTVDNSCWFITWNISFVRTCLPLNKTFIKQCQKRNTLNLLNERNKLL